MVFFKLNCSKGAIIFIREWSLKNIQEVEGNPLELQVLVGV